MQIGIKLAAKPQNGLELATRVAGVSIDLTILGQRLDFLFGGRMNVPLGRKLRALRC